jgi:hypothetical protein
MQIICIMLNDILQTTDAPASEAGFINECELQARLKVSRGSIINYRKAGKLPFVKLGRRVLFHWPTVETALLRQHKGGE